MKRAVKSRSNPWPFSSRATSPRNTTPASGGIAARRGKPAKAKDHFRQHFKEEVERIEGSLKRLDRLNPPRKRNGLGSTAATATSYLTGVGTAARVASGIAQMNPKQRMPRCAQCGELLNYSGGNLWECVNYGCRKHGVMVKGRKVKTKKRNPAEASERAFEDFHGRKPSEEIAVTERRHHHKFLASAGALKRLEVYAIDGKHLVTIHFKKTFLAFNEDRNQLFIVGGDQSVDMRDFGIKLKDAHEVETLGRVKSIDYATKKDHLGEEGGDAIYRHGFRMTNQDGRHVTVRIARYPDLIYRQRDEALEFSGGSYKILAEGIDR